VSSDSIRAQLMKGTTPYLVLAVLRDGEAYGYEISRRIRERSAGEFIPSEGALYPALHRLESERAVTATWREGAGGPRRRWYAITEGGLGALASHEAEWQRFSQAVSLVGRSEPSRG
jgi:PadR family transcriptional regulator, regulatory protein PadR